MFGIRAKNRQSYVLDRPFKNQTKQNGGHFLFVLFWNVLKTELFKMMSSLNSFINKEK